MAEVMRGLWGDATNVAAQNIADIDSLEQQIANSFDLPGSLARRSIDYGHTVGAAVYQTSRDDGEDRSYLTNFPTSYVPPVCDGCWVPTAPGQIALQPFWKDEMTTFVFTPGDCAEDGLPAFSTDPASEAYQEAYEVYVTRNNLSPEQAIIARFWADGPGTINGPGHSLSTTSQILQLVDANLAEAAETYARVGLAVGDGVYTVWSSRPRKLDPAGYVHQSLLRPGLDHVAADATVPQYTSAHSGQTSSAINTLIALWGDIGYTDHTHDSDGFAPRTFASLTDSMNETAVSRIYARHPLPLGDLRRHRPGPLRGGPYRRPVLAQVSSLLTFRRAALCLAELPHGHSALCRASCRHAGSDAPHRPRGVERREETADDRFHADHGPPAAALRPPPSASRPTHRGRDRRHGPRSPSLNGAWLAGRGADGRGLSGCGGPHGAGAPTGGPEAAATRPEAHGAAPARAGPATNLRVSPHRSASDLVRRAVRTCV